MDQGARVSGAVVKSLTLALISWAIVGCGVVGGPIPPEDVGVAPVIERQKREQAQRAGAQPQDQEPLPSELRGQDEELPPLRPVGTR
jgi:predicted small lipoprotein YifL